LRPRNQPDDVINYSNVLPVETQENEDRTPREQLQLHQVATSTREQVQPQEQPTRTHEHEQTPTRRLRPRPTLTPAQQEARDVQANIEAVERLEEARFGMQIHRNLMPEVERGQQRLNCQQRYHGQIAPTYRTAFNARIRDCEVAVHSCGLMNVSCQCCNSLNFAGELDSSEQFNRFSRCCQKGKVQLPELGPTPTILERLLKGSTKLDKNYRTNVVHYNASLAFASREAKLVRPPGHGPYCMTLHGTVYHGLGGLEPGPRQRRQYAQLYFIDADEALQQRMQNDLNSECMPGVMRCLDRLIRDINPYYHSFKSMHDKLQEEKATAVRTNQSFVEPRMYLVHRDHEDARRYNDPVNQSGLAVVFTSEDGELPTMPHLRVYPITGRKFQELHCCDPNRDPMTYPLLFPNGELGTCSN
jgi:hypothetical protein